MRHDPLDSPCPDCGVPPGTDCVQIRTISSSPPMVHLSRVQAEEIRSDDERQGVFVVVGSADYGGAWGRGGTVDLAKFHFRRNGGILSRGYRLLHWQPGVTNIQMDGMGTLSWNGPSPHVRQYKARERP